MFSICPYCNLIFTGWNSLPFLWGVFRGRRVYDSSSPSLNTMNVSEGLCSPVSFGPESKLVSAPCIFENSIQGSEVVDLAVLQSSAPIKVEDQGYEHDVASLEKDIQKTKHIQADTAPFVHDRRKDDLYSGLLGDDLQVWFANFHIATFDNNMQF